MARIIAVGYSGGGGDNVPISSVIRHRHYHFIRNVCFEKQVRLGRARPEVQRTSLVIRKATLIRGLGIRDDDNAAVKKTRCPGSRRVMFHAAKVQSRFTYNQRRREVCRPASESLNLQSYDNGNSVFAQTSSKAVNWFATDDAWNPLLWRGENFFAGTRVSSQGTQFTITKQDYCRSRLKTSARSQTSLTALAGGDLIKRPLLGWRIDATMLPPHGNQKV